MILEKITSQCIRAAQAGLNNADSRFEMYAVEDLVVETSRWIILQMYNGSQQVGGNQLIPSELYISANLTYNKDIQDPEADFIIFPTPGVVRLNEHSNGFTYVGKKNSAKSFSQVKSWEHASILSTLGEIYPNGGEYFLHDGQNLVVFGNSQLKSLNVKVIPADARQWDSFDEYTMDWPVPGDMIPMLIDQVALRLLARASQQTPNTINDGNDVLPLPQTILK